MFLSVWWQLDLCRCAVEKQQTFGLMFGASMTNCDLNKQKWIQWNGKLW